jgi:hypothetical protein
MLTMGWPRCSSSILFAWPVRVSISPGVIECVSTVVPEHRLEHRDPEVVITRARLIPLSFLGGTTMELVGAGGDRAAIQVRFGIRRVREALLGAGFVVRDQRKRLPPFTNWPPLKMSLRTPRP